MKILGNPFIAEDLSDSFTRVSALRSYPVFIAVMAAVMMIWWPRIPLTAHLRAGNAPETFFAVALCLFGCLAYLAARFGAEGFSNESASKILDFVTLTPVPVSSVVAGRLSASVIHTVFLLALGLPFLFLGSTVNGTAISVISRVVLVSGTSALALRAFAFLCFVLLEPHRLLKDGVIIFCGLAFLIATTSAVQPLSPISAILSLGEGAVFTALGPAVPFYLVSVIMSVLAAAVFYLAAGVWLRVLRRRFAVRQTAIAAANEARAERLLKRMWNEESDADGSR